MVLTLHIFLLLFSVWGPGPPLACPRPTKTFSARGGGKCTTQKLFYNGKVLFQANNATSVLAYALELTWLPNGVLLLFAPVPAWRLIGALCMFSLFSEIPVVK